MMLRSLALAAAVASLPLAAGATTFTTIGNQTSIFYDTVDPNLDLGAFDLAVEPVGVTALFTAANVTGSLTFDVVWPGGLNPRGSVDVNIVQDNESFSGTFNGDTLDFMGVGGDFVATFGAGATPAQFVLNFAGFDPGDQFQVNVSAIPLPASVLMLLGALGGLALIGRRRRA